VALSTSRFAFSSENWRRPKDEVSFLMQLFVKSLKAEIERIHRNEIRLRVVEISPPSTRLWCPSSAMGRR
jgi:undecaprenyl diphosphate synthase